MKKILLWLLVSIVSVSMVLTFTLVGCKAPVEEAAPAEEEVEEEAPAEEVAEEEAEAEVPQELNIALSEDIEDFDPHTDQLMLYRQIFRLMLFNTLVQYDKDLELQPQLAESWENPDEKTYVFNLRKGVKFHNGKEFKAEDVKYTFERVLDEKTGSFVAVDLQNIDSMNVVDDYTLEIVLKSPSVAFLDNITTVSIVPSDPTIDLKRDPIGTGPYKFVEYIANDRTVFSKFDDYWEEGIPKNSKITFKVIPEPQVSVTNLAAGSVDIIALLSPVLAESVESNPDLKVLMTEDTTDLLFFEINCSEEPLSNPKVRQAMAMCFDYDAFGSITYKGYGSVTNNPIAHQMFGYKDVGMYDYNPEKAKEILEEEGYPNGFDLTIECLAGPDQYEQMSVIWKDGLDKAGINTNVEVTEVQVWLDKFLNHKYQVTINEYATRADPFSFFNTIIIGDRIVEFFENKEEIEEMIREANTLMDEEERAKKYEELQDWIFDELPAVFVFYRVPFLMGMKKNVEDVTINAIGNYDFSRAYLK